MTVRELRQHLLQYPDDAVVLTDHPGCPCCGGLRGKELREDQIVEYEITGEYAQKFVLVNPPD